MEHLLTPLFWLIDLFDVRAIDPLIRAYKKAQLGIFVYFIAALICFGLSWLIDPYTSEQAATTATLISREIKHVLAGVLLLVGIGLVVLSLRFYWVLYRVHMKPETFY